MKKKSLLFFALALALSLCLVLTACGDKNGEVSKLIAENGITLDGVFENDSAVSIPTAMAASGKLTPTSTGMNAPAAQRLRKRHIPPANGSPTLRQRLPLTVQSIRNAPSAAI